MARSNDMMNILEQWKPDMTRGIVARAADLLNFVKGKKPGAPVAWTHVTKCVLGGRIPHADSKAVKDMMGRSSGIRAILMRDYGCGLENIQGLGVRATVDDDDLANTQLRRQVKQHEASRQRVLATRALINPSAMKNKELKGWVNNGVGALLSAHNDRIAKLLLPPGDEPTDKGGQGGPRR
ncbi:MAG TPA: hypothetical protein VFA98_06305 [Thermoanaerobaculia bacterium]|nr:hypothetical protein [Thermoanaerobaculia bacterium]